MSAYYGIEESTDAKCPRTKIVRLRSRRAAESFAATKTHLTYADPDAARNYHHTLYSAFEMPSRWRPPSKRAMRTEIDEHYKWGSRAYPLTEAILIARAIRRDGTELCS